MATRGTKKKTTRKKTTRKKTARKTAKRTTKKKAAKKPAAKRRKATAKKKTAKKKPAKRRKVATKKKAAKKRKSKKKTKKAAKKSRNAAAIEAHFERRIGQLTDQLDDLREFAEKELSRQRKRFDALVQSAREEQTELTNKLSKFIDEHDSWQEVSQSVKDTAQELEARVKSAVARITEPRRDD